MLDTTKQVEQLQITLSKFLHEELGQFLVEMATRDRGFLRKVHKRFPPEMTVDTLVAATRNIDLRCDLLRWPKTQYQL